MAGPVRIDYCGKLSDPTAIRLCNDVADTCDEIFADAVGAELDERPFVLTLEGGGKTHGEGKASCYQRARSLGSLGRKIIPQDRLQAQAALALEQLAKLDSNYFICRSEDLAGTRKGALCQEYLDTFCSGPPSYHRNEKGESVSSYAFNSFDR